MLQTEAELKETQRRYREKNKVKRNEYNKAWNRRNPEKANERARRSYLKKKSESPEIFRVRAAAYYKKNKAKVAARRSVHRKALRELNKAKVREMDAKDYARKKPAIRARYRKDARNLTDRYIKNALMTSYGIDASIVTPELIKLKREQLKLHRLIKEK